MEMTQGRLYLSTTCLTQAINNYIYSGAFVYSLSQYISFSAEIGIPQPKTLDSFSFSSNMFKTNEALDPTCETAHG
jgi:hypothetical protein